MNTALLRQCKIKVYSPIRTQNVFGEWDDSYQLKKTYRAGLLSQSMNRNVTEDEYFHPMYKEFIVRAYTDIKETDIVEFEGKYYDITSVEQNQYFNNIQIKCELAKDTKDIKEPTPQTPNNEPIEQNNEQIEQNG